MSFSIDAKPNTSNGVNYQIIWQEKIKRLPEEIFSRLEKTTDSPDLYRALLIGKSTEFILTGLNRFLSPSKWKVFISAEKPTGNHEASPDNLIYLKGHPSTHLASFPAGIFDLAISLWDLPPKNPDNLSYIKNLHRLLKKRGQLSVITYLDGSPELPLKIIKRTIERKKLPLKVFKSGLPDSTGDFRKMLNKTGFGDIRIWKDHIICTYQSPEDLYYDIFPALPAGGPDGGENLFMDNTPDEQRLTVKKEFIKEAKGYSFPLEISYNFAGGVGVKP